jgi:hypothetical protein
LFSLGNGERLRFPALRLGDLGFEGRFVRERDLDLLKLRLLSLDFKSP